MFLLDNLYSYFNFKAMGVYRQNLNLAVFKKQIGKMNEICFQLKSKKANRREKETIMFHRKMLCVKLKTETGMSSLVINFLFKNDLQLLPNILNTCRHDI